MHVVTHMRWIVGRKSMLKKFIKQSIWSKINKWKKKSSLLQPEGVAQWRLSVSWEWVAWHYVMAESMEVGNAYPELYWDGEVVQFGRLSSAHPGGYSTGIWVGASKAKQAALKTLKTVHKFAFSHIPTRAHKISANYVIEGGEKDICGDDPFKTRTSEVVYPV